MDEHSIISQMFYGKSIEVLTASEEDGTPVSSESKNTFGQLILDVEHKDILNAWDNSCHDKIEGYITPLGFTTTAAQEVWIESCPQILLFQVQRVKYDVETGMGVKVHSKFEFTEELYVDRFMHQNKELSTKLRHRCLELSGKVKTLEAAIDEYENYNGTGASLEITLSNSIAFLEAQLAPPPEIKEETGITVYATACVLKLEESAKAGIQANIESLRSYLAEVQKQVTEMKEQVSKLQQEIKALYDVPELKNHPYVLHSILVHDGQAGSGHYFAYIFEQDSQTWRKYSDINVTVVDAAEVLENSVGGKGQNSAYCLFYVEPTAISKGQKLMRQYSIAQNDATDMYSDFIPEHLKNEVHKDNEKMMMEIVEYQISSQVKEIQDHYVERQSIASSQAQAAKDQKVKNTNIQHELINFAVYLEMENKSNLSRWIICDSCVKKVDPHQRPLTQLTPDDPLYVKLKTQFLGKTRDTPRALELESTDSASYQTYSELYARKIRDATCTTYIINRMNDLDWVTSIQGIRYLNANCKPEDRGQYQQIPKDISRMMVLRLCSEVNREMYNHNLEKGVWLAKIVNIVGVLLIEANDIHFQQAKHNLEKTFGWVQANETEQFETWRPSFDKILTDMAAG